MNKEKTPTKPLISMQDQIAITGKFSKKRKAVLGILATVLLAAPLTFLIITKSNLVSEKVTPTPSVTPTPTPSLSTRDIQYALMHNGADVLVRDKHDWDASVHWKDWLFIAAADQATSIQDDSNPTPAVQLFGYNFATNDYRQLGTITQYPEWATVSSVNVYDDTLYVALSGYKTGGITYSCQLDAAKGCGDLQKFYDGDGWVIKRAGMYFLQQGFGDAGASSTTISRLNPTTKELTEVLNVDANMGVGTYLLTVDQKGRSWVEERAGNIEATSVDEADGRFKELYAVDTKGKKVASYVPGDIPLEGSISVSISAYPSDNPDVALQTDTQQVVLNLSNLTFSSVSAPVNVFDEANSFQQRVDYLQLPTGFTLTQRSY
jgi:hypothetical protein